MIKNMTNIINNVKNGYKYYIQTQNNIMCLFLYWGDSSNYCVKFSDEGISYYSTDNDNLIVNEVTEDEFKKDVLTLKK